MKNLIKNVKKEQQIWYHGPVNDEMDEFFLKCITDRDYDTLRNWSYEYIEEHLGNGGQEIRNWIVLLGCLQDL